MDTLVSATNNWIMPFCVCNGPCHTRLTVVVTLVLHWRLSARIRDLIKVFTVERHSSLKTCHFHALIKHHLIHQTSVDKAFHVMSKLKDCFASANTPGTVNLR